MAGTQEDFACSEFVSGGFWRSETLRQQNGEGLVIVDLYFLQSAIIFQKAQSHISTDMFNFTFFI